MKIKVSKTRVLVSLSPREYERLQEVVAQCEDDLSSSTSDTWGDMIDFCGKFLNACSAPVRNLRGKK